MAVSLAFFLTHLSDPSLSSPLVSDRPVTLQMPTSKLFTYSHFLLSSLYLLLYTLAWGAALPARHWSWIPNSQLRLRNLSHLLHSVDYQVLMIWTLKSLLKSTASCPSILHLPCLRPHHSFPWTMGSTSRQKGLSVGHHLSHCQRKPSLRQIQPHHCPGYTHLWLTEKEHGSMAGTSQPLSSCTAPAPDSAALCSCLANLFIFLCSN